MLATCERHGGNGLFFIMEALLEVFFPVVSVLHWFPFSPHCLIIAEDYFHIEETHLIHCVQALCGGKLTRPMVPL